jgi:hypothetical protein
MLRNGPHSAPDNSPGAYLAAVLTATIRESRVTDSSSQGSNRSNISLDFPANNTNNGPVTGLMAGAPGITGGKTPGETV